MKCIIWRIIKILSVINIYLLNKKYSYSSYAPPVSSIFGLKGVITHDVITNKSYYYSYYYSSKLLRGLYIDDNLYTVSETAVKVNNLETLDLINELKIK